MMGIIDWILVNHLFRTNDRGETIFYPNGFMARGYLVPPDLVSALRSRVRRLALIVWIGAPTLAVFAPRLIESWFDVRLPLTWYIVGAVIGVVIFVPAIIYYLKRLTEGLDPA